MFGVIVFGSESGLPSWQGLAASSISAANSLGSLSMRVPNLVGQGFGLEVKIMVKGPLSMRVTNLWALRDKG